MSIIEIPCGHVFGTTNIFWCQFINLDTKVLKLADKISQAK